MDIFNDTEVKMTYRNRSTQEQLGIGCKNYIQYDSIFELLFLLLYMFFLHFFCAYSYLRSTFHNTKNLTLKNGSRAFEWDRSFLDITFLLP